MSDRVINIPGYAPIVAGDLAAPVLIDDMKAGWPYFKEMGKQKTGRAPKLPASLSVVMRCGLLAQFLGDAEPTEAQFKVMAEAPLDGSVPKEELLRKLGL
jgi:hypothetical protein